jgi:hypothetical protein
LNDSFRPPAFEVLAMNAVLAIALFAACLVNLASLFGYLGGVAG